MPSSPLMEVEPSASSKRPPAKRSSALELRKNIGEIGGVHAAEAPHSSHAGVVLTVFVFAHVVALASLGV